VVYNADFSQGLSRLLFAINPTASDVKVPVGAEIAAGAWGQVASHERFFGPEGPGATQPVVAELLVPSLGCGLWAADS